MSLPYGAPVAAYLSSRHCFIPTKSIRYLHASDGYYPTMIAKFQGVSAVHLTRLRPDGSGKAGTDHDKLIKGPCSGFPIVLRSGRWTQPLVICEGIEDGLSLIRAFPNWTVWAAGSAGHIHHLIRAADRSSETAVVVDDDMAGEGAAKRSISINPDTKVIRFQKGLDANAILVKHGLNALREFVTRHQPFHR
jgi:hypothetical protein